MADFKVGILLDSFRCGTAEAMAKAGALGVAGVQLYATSGAMAPENLTAKDRRALLALAKDNGLAVSALCGDLGQGFGDPDKNPALIERSKRILDLAVELESSVVTTHIGVIPPDATHPRYAAMQAACFELAQYADSLNAHFAVETGPENAATLKAFLDSLQSTGVAVNLDPANLVMVTGDDPVRAVHTLGGYIVHTHAKDGRKLREEDPEVIYGLRPAPPSAAAGEPFIELPLGAGDVDWPAYLGALEAIGYHGFLTIEREVGAQPEADIRQAVGFLNSLLRNGERGARNG